MTDCKLRHQDVIWLGQPSCAGWRSIKRTARGVFAAPAHLNQWHLRGGRVTGGRDAASRRITNACDKPNAGSRHTPRGVVRPTFASPCAVCIGVERVVGIYQAWPKSLTAQTLRVRSGRSTSSHSSNSSASGVGQQKGDRRKLIGRHCPIAMSELIGSAG
jgi:hypothetical protein